jgi:transcriptional regulator with XRE-family HTH domain
VSGPDQKLVGERIRELRHAAGLTQDELGMRALVTASHLSNIERGEIDVGLAALGRIATALELPVAALIGDTSELSPKAISFARSFDAADPELQTALLSLLSSLTHERGQA